MVSTVSEREVSANKKIPLKDEKQRLLSGKGEVYVVKFTNGCSHLQG